MTVQEEDHRGMVCIPDGGQAKGGIISAKRVALYKEILQIALPAFVELMLVQVMSMVSLMMVGSLGADAISAVGLAAQPRLIMVNLFSAANIGATALVARYKGANEPEKAKRVLNQTLLLVLIISTFGSIIGFIFSHQLISFMGGEGAALEGGARYLQIQMAGFVFFALTSTITAVLRGVGNTKSAMIYNLAANVVNIIFNYLLVVGRLGFPRLGVAGSSLAIVIGQVVGCLMAFYAVTNKKGFVYFSLKTKIKPDKAVIKQIARFGLPATVEQFGMRVGMILFTKTVTFLGIVVFATHQIGTNILTLSFALGTAFAVASTSLTGQSLGKGRADMAVAYTRCTMTMGVLLSCLTGVLLFFFGGQIVAAYTDDPEIIRLGSAVLKFAAAVQPLQCLQLILAGSLRGAGDTKSVAAIIMITTFIVRPLLSMLLTRVLFWGIFGAWTALVADQSIRSLFVYLRFKFGKWDKIIIK